MTVEAKKQTTGILRYLPILAWLPHYQSRWLRPDFIAGLTIMALLVPEGMAYAQLAGVPPQAGLYMAPATLLAYAIFGTSRHLVVAISSAAAVMSASIIIELAPTGSEEFIVLTAALAIMTGVVAVVAGLLRLGRISQFFSESVLMGFVAGLALVIMIKQVPKLFGLEAVEGNFWQRVVEIMRELPETHLLTLAVGLSTILLILFVEHRFKRIPAALVALIYSIGVVTVFGLAGQGVEIVGEIPAGLARPQIPDVSLDDWLLLIPGALAMILVVFSEGIGPDRTFAAKHGYEIDEDQELIAMGMTNIGAGLFQGFSNGVSLSKSAAAEAAGGTTQLAGIIAAIAVALVALFLTPFFYNLPEAALGAIIVVAVSGMFKPQEFRRLYRVRKLDFWLAVIACLGVLTFEEVLVGLLIAVAVSLLALINRNSQPRISILGRLPGTVRFQNIETHPEAIQFKDVLIVRPDEGIFFANAASLRKAIQAQLGADDRAIQTVLLDLELSNDLDAPSIEMVEKLRAELEAQDIRLILAGLHTSVRDMLDRSGVTAKIGADNYYLTVIDALLVTIQANSDGLTADEVAAIIHELDSLTEIISAVAARANAEDQATLNAVLAKLGREPRAS